MNIKNIEKHIIFLEKCFNDIKENYENENPYNNKIDNIIKYYRNNYLKALKKYDFLKKDWLYKEFFTKSLNYIPIDRWILIGIAIESKDCVNIVMWDYINNILLDEYSIEEFYTDIEHDVYEIKEIE